MLIGSRLSNQLCRTALALYVLLLTIGNTTLASTAEDPLISELRQIKSSYHIPGMSVIVTQGGVKQPLRTEFEFYEGELSKESNSQVTAKTHYPIASITKVFSAHAILSLANEGKLSIDDSVVTWLPESNLPKYLKIKNLLTHTLLGEEGDTFFYDVRYGLLTKIAQLASEQSFKEYIEIRLKEDFEERQIVPYLESEVSRLEEAGGLAQGHIFDGNITPITHDLGLSASAGLVATPAAISRTGINFMHVHQKDVSEYSVLKSYGSSEPYANGFFRQKFSGHDVLWSYGQYDGYAALWIMVPAQELQLVMLSNNNILSDASRLIFGDVSASPLAVWFMKHYLCNDTDCDTDEMDVKADLHRHVYFSRYDKASYETAVELMQTRYANDQQWLDSANKNLLHLSNYLKVVSSRLGYDIPDWQAPELAFILQQSKLNNGIDPYWHFYTGVIYDRNGKLKEAKEAFSKLLEIPNMPNHWTLQEAENWLKQNHSD